MSARRDYTTNTINRLAQIDAILAGEGITVSAAAEQFGYSPKSFRRDVDTLRQLGAEIPAGPKGAQEEHLFRYPYRQKRVFSKWVAERGNKG